MESVWVCSSEYMLWLLTWWSCETPASGSGCICDSFATSWDSFPTIPTTFSSLKIRIFALFYILFHCVWLMPFGSLLCFEGEQRGSEIGGGGKFGRSGEEGKLWLGCFV